MLTVGFLLVAIGFTRWLGDDLPSTVEARTPRVTDGDSLVMRGHRVRLLGIDAPEGRQTCLLGDKDWRCGAEAAQRLRRLTQGRKVACKILRRDRYNRLLGLCRTGDVDINRWMVEQGWAVSYGRYKSSEQRARAARRGIWQARFKRPQHWRRDRRADASMSTRLRAWLNGLFNGLEEQEHEAQ